MRLQTPIRSLQSPISRSCCNVFPNTITLSFDDESTVESNTMFWAPIHNRSRYVDLEIEARNDESIEDFVLYKHPSFLLRLFS